MFHMKFRCSNKKECLYMHEFILEFLHGVAMVIVSTMQSDCFVFFLLLGKPCRVLALVSDHHHHSYRFLG